MEGFSMRVAQFIETDVAGGAEKLLIELCLWTQKTGHTPIVIHFNHPYFLEQCERYGIEQIVISDNKNFKKTARLLLFALEFKKLLKKYCIDVLHSHLFGPITGAALGAKLAGVPHVGTIHDVYMIEEKPSRIRLLQWAAWCGCYLVTVSKLMENFYRNRARFSQRSLRTIYNTVQDPANFLGEEFNRQKIKSQYKLDGNSVIVTFVGRLVALKRCEDLIEAMSIVSRQLGEHQLHLLIAGDGPELNKLQALAVDSCASSHIKFLGRVDAVYELLAASDIYTQVSETEGLSLSILEAVASGLPAVLTDVGSNCEVVQHEQSGYLIGVNEPEQLANALIALYQSPEQRDVFSKKARKKYENEYEYTQKMNEYIALYEKVSS